MDSTLGGVPGEWEIYTPAVGGPRGLLGFLAAEIPEEGPILQKKGPGDRGLASKV